MNCPHCHKELPGDFSGANCPACAGSLAAVPPVVARAKMNWWVFMVALLSPPVITMATVLLGGREGDVAAGVAGIASVGGALVCGSMIGMRQRGPLPTRIVLSIVISGLMFIPCIGMSCFGCLASGYDLNLH